MFKVNCHFKAVVIHQFSVVTQASLPADKIRSSLITEGIQALGKFVSRVSPLWGLTLLLALSLGSPAATQNLNWVKSDRSTRRNTGYSIAVDGSGNSAEDIFVSTANLEITASGNLTVTGSFTLEANGITIHKFKIVNNDFSGVFGYEVSGADGIGLWDANNNTIGSDNQANANAAYGIVLNTSMSGNTLCDI